MNERYACIDHYGFNWIDQFGYLHFIPYNINYPYTTITALNHASFDNIPNCKSVMTSNRTSIALLQNGEIIIKARCKLLTTDQLNEMGCIVCTCTSHNTIGILNDLNMLYILDIENEGGLHFYQDVLSMQSYNLFYYIVFSTKEYTFISITCTLLKCKNLYVTCMLFQDYFIGITSDNLMFYVRIPETTMNALTETLINFKYIFTKIIYSFRNTYLIDSKKSIWVSDDYHVTLKLEFYKRGEVLNESNDIFYLDNRGAIKCIFDVEKYVDCKDSSRFNELNYYDVKTCMLLNTSGLNFILIKLNNNIYKVYKLYNRHKDISLPDVFSLREDTVEGSYI